MKKVISVIISLFLVVVLLINIFSYMQIPFFKMRIFRVGSGSMEPTLSIDDIIIVKEFDTYEKDDIITFTDDAKTFTTTHRILEVSEEGYLTKGDANNTEDGIVKRDNVVGKLILKVANFGFLTYIFAQPIFLVLIAVICIALIFLMAGKKKEAEEELEEDTSEEVIEEFEETENVDELNNNVNTPETTNFEEYREFDNKDEYMEVENQEDDEKIN